MKKYLLILFASLALTGCDAYKDLKDAEDITSISVHVSLDFNIENVTEVKDLKLKLDNYDEDIHYEKTINDDEVDISGIMPGIYTVNVSGTAFDNESNEYLVNGSAINQPVFQNGNTLSLDVKGQGISPLVFKEIYYACSKTPLNKSYIYDQFYEIYNNSPKTLHLDGIHFADLTPIRATSTLPIWPEEDGNDYVYGNRVWKFPGNGQDYPLQPGESCIIATFAVNHQQENYNPNSPVNLSNADFEFYMDNVSYPNQPAPDMVHVFYKGKAEKGTTPKQYNTSAFGGAYVIFQVPEGETWDPVNDPKMHATELNKSTKYAKIPIRYVLDAVECIDNESKMNAKRIPGILDAGITWVGKDYNGLSVTRKISLDENGLPLQRENGAYIYQDTNNSTDDFERGVVPILRRNNADIPEWNHTLIQK